MNNVHLDNPRALALSKSLFMVFGIIALILLSCKSAFALPVGNPAEASLLTWGVINPSYACRNTNPCCFWFDNWALKIGYYGDFVFNRHLKVRGDPLGQGEDIQKTQIFTNAGYLALNLCNKVDIFGTLGASRIMIRTNEASWFLSGAAEGRLEWDSNFSWSAGARGTLYRANGFFFGVEGQYFQTNPNLKDYVSYAGGLFNYFNHGNNMSYKEWQAGVGVSYALTSSCPSFSVVPYVASKWAWTHFDTHDFTFVKTDTVDTLTIFNLKAAKWWGFAFGTTFVFWDLVDFTVEGRWGDESAFYVNGNCRF